MYCLFSARERAGRYRCLHRVVNGHQYPINARTINTTTHTRTRTRTRNLAGLPVSPLVGVGVGQWRGEPCQARRVSDEGYL